MVNLDTWFGLEAIQILEGSNETHYPNSVYLLK